MLSKSDLIQQAEIILFRKKNDANGVIDQLFESYSNDNRTLIIKAITIFMSFSRNSIENDLSKIIDLLASSNLNEAEQIYLKFFRCIILFDYASALDFIIVISEKNPNDLLAVSMLALLGFVSGLSHKIVTPYENLMPYYKDDSDYLGMLAFIYAHHKKNKSLDISIQALQRAPHNAWVQHVYFHAVECSKMYDSLKLIKEVEPMSLDWPKQNRFFEGHNWMHLCLLKMQQQYSFDELLKDYNDHIWGEAKGLLFEQNNAFIFLWMAEIYGYQVPQGYWNDLANYAKQQINNYFSPYFSITTILSLAKVCYKDINMLTSQYSDFAQDFPENSHEYKAWYVIGMPILEGMLAYIKGNFALSANMLNPVMAENYLLGHSDEQRAIFPETLDRCLNGL